MAILSSPTPISPLPAETVIVPASFTLTDGVTIAVDATQGEVAKVTLEGNRTLSTPTGGIGGQRLVVIVTQDAVGSRTLAFGAGYSFVGFPSSPPALNPAAAAKTIFQFIFDAESSLWRCIGATSASVLGDFATVTIAAAANNGTAAVGAQFNSAKCVCSLKTNAGVVAAVPVAFKGVVAGGTLTVTCIDTTTGLATNVTAEVTIDVALGF